MNNAKTFKMDWKINCGIRTLEEYVTIYSQVLCSILYISSLYKLLVIGKQIQEERQEHIINIALIRLLHRARSLK